MTGDPLREYFRDLRNEILKEGPPAPSGRTIGPGRIDTRFIDSLVPPPGARGFGIGDKLGGSGWVVEMPDGSMQTYYVELPPEWTAEIPLHMPTPPAEHLGRPLTDTSFAALSHVYLDYLERLVTAAERHFGS